MLIYQIKIAYLLKFRTKYDLNVYNYFTSETSSFRNE